MTQRFRRPPEPDVGRHTSGSTVIWHNLAQLDNQQLYGLLAGGKAAEKQNRVVKLGSTRIFVKRVPVTYLEYIHMHSTANYYDLPSYFNFGGGGGGLGVFLSLIHI